MLKKKHQKRLNNIINNNNDDSNENNVVSNKHNLLCVIKNYLFGLYFLTIYIVGLIPSFTIRKLIYCHIFLMKIGKNTKIREFLEVLSPWNIVIGDNTIIGKNCILDGRNGIIIGNNVNISDSCAIWTEQHDIDDAKFKTKNFKNGLVKIGNRAWLCFRSIVLPSVYIKEGCVLATAALATKNCEEYGLYCGIPAKRIRDRNKNIDYELDTDWAHIY